jgi:hypothetical protein
MAIYEKPTKTLMLEFVKEHLKAGQVFTKQEAVDWFAARYPKLRSTTVQMHVEGMSVNSSARKHHPSIKPNSGHDLFIKVAPGRFRLWQPETDSEPVYGDQARSLTSADILETVEAPEVDKVYENSGEFAFERDLRNYLSKNLPSIETGLTVFKDEDFTGIEFPVGGRFIDILAIDANGDYVIIELKVSRGHERVIGQILRYMGWVKKNMASGKNVRGIIVANEVSEDLQLAASLIPNLQLFEYAIAMKVTPVIPLL